LGCRTKKSKLHRANIKGKGRENERGWQLGVYEQKIRGGNRNTLY